MLWHRVCGRVSACACYLRGYQSLFPAEGWRRRHLPPASTPPLGSGRPPTGCGRSFSTSVPPLPRLYLKRVFQNVHVSKQVLTECDMFTLGRVTHRSPPGLWATRRRGWSRRHFARISVSFSGRPPSSLDARSHEIGWRNKGGGANIRHLNGGRQTECALWKGKGQFPTEKRPQL